MTNEVEVTLLRLEPSEYATLVDVERGQPLTDTFPNQIYVMFRGKEVLEIAPALTPQMRECFPSVEYPMANDSNNSYGRVPQGLQTFALRDENGSISGFLTAEQIIHTAKDEAYKEAAKAMCGYCRHASPAPLIGSAVSDLVPLGETAYIHHADGGYIRTDTRCEASAIHALRNSLVAELVPS